jgi:asparagine N-glycosylation enzyme membrane subunit Stt3
MIVVTIIKSFSDIRDVNLTTSKLFNTRKISLKYIDKILDGELLNNNITIDDCVIKTYTKYGSLIEYDYVKEVNIDDHIQQKINIVEKFYMSQSKHFKIYIFDYEDSDIDILPKNK